MQLLNKLSYKGKDYVLEDTRGFTSLKSKGVPQGFYGGRVTQLAITEEPGLYMCMEVMVPIDLLLIDSEIEYPEVPFDDIKGEAGVPGDDKGLPSEDFNEYTVAQLKECLEAYDVEFPSKAVKTDLIKLLETHLESI